jgi:hypothetical protein
MPEASRSAKTAEMLGISYHQGPRDGSGRHSRDQKSTAQAHAASESRVPPIRCARRTGRHQAGLQEEGCEANRYVGRDKAEEVGAAEDSGEIPWTKRATRPKDFDPEKAKEELAASSSKIPAPHHKDSMTGRLDDMRGTFAERAAAVFAKLQKLGVKLELESLLHTLRDLKQMLWIARPRTGPAT